MDNTDWRPDREKAPAGPGAQSQDLKQLWDKWDQTLSEDSPTQYLKGSNALGLGLLLAGVPLMVWGTPLVQLAGNGLTFTGVLLLAVKRIKALWWRRSLSG